MNNTSLNPLPTHFPRWVGRNAHSMCIGFQVNVTSWIGCTFNAHCSSHVNGPLYWSSWQTCSTCCICITVLHFLIATLNNTKLACIFTFVYIHTDNPLLNSMRRASSFTHWCANHAFLLHFFYKPAVTLMIYSLKSVIVYNELLKLGKGFKSCLHKYCAAMNLPSFL